jgi:hypothetical protein
MMHTKEIANAYMNSGRLNSVSLYFESQQAELDFKIRCDACVLMIRKHVTIKSGSQNKAGAPKAIPEMFYDACVPSYVPGRNTKADGTCALSVQGIHATEAWEGWHDGMGPNKHGTCW